MIGQPINIFPLRGGAVVKTFIFTPLRLKLMADKFLIFFIMTADLIPLLNVQMDHLVAIECSSEAVRVDVSCEDLSLKTDLGAMKTVSRHFLDPTKIVLVDS
jgi:hypothetical protein